MPRREITLERRTDGFWKLTGLLDDETGARTAAALEAYAAPRPVDEFGQTDLRMTCERLGDAWADILDFAIACPDQPGTSGYRTLVHVTIGLDDLKSGLGTTCLDYIGQMTARETRLTACDCLMLPIVMNAAGEPLDPGRLRRFVTPGQRRTLNIRDGGCAFPGCHRRPKHWADGGPTDLRNLVLLCGFHHRLIHHGDWQVHIAADGPLGMPGGTLPLCEYMKAPFLALDARKGAFMYSARGPSRNTHSPAAVTQALTHTNAPRNPQDLSAASATKMPVSRKTRHCAGDSLCRAR